MVGIRRINLRWTAEIKLKYALLLTPKISRLFSFITLRPISNFNDLLNNNYGLYKKKLLNLISVDCKLTPWAHDQLTFDFPSFLHDLVVPKESSCASVFIILVFHWFVGFLNSDSIIFSQTKMENMMALQILWILLENYIYFHRTRIINDLFRSRVVRCFTGIFCRLPIIRLMDCREEKLTKFWFDHQILIIGNR